MELAYGDCVNENSSVLGMLREFMGLDKPDIDVCVSPADMVRMLEKYKLQVMPDGPTTWFCETQLSNDNHYVSRQSDPISAVAAWLAIYGENPNHGIRPGGLVQHSGGGFLTPNYFSGEAVVLQVGKWDAVIAYDGGMPFSVCLCNLVR